MASLTSRIARRIRRLTLSRLPKPRPQELVIIGDQRTGSNFLCDSLRAFPGSLAFHEIYHHNAVKGVIGDGRPEYVLDELGRRFGMALALPNDRRLIERFHAQPEEAWDALADIAVKHRKTLLSFKIFEGHLPRDTLAFMLRRRRPAIIFLVRNRLDTYISLRKARKARGWSHLDTTGLEVEISPKWFLRWSQRLDRWYANVDHIASQAGLRTLVLRYEDHLVGDREQVVRTLELAFPALGLKLDPPDAVPPSSYFRQDKRSSPFDKIVNGENLKATLIELGRLDYALDAPMSDRAWRT